MAQIGHPGYPAPRLRAETRRPAAIAITRPMPTTTTATVDGDAVNPAGVGASGVVEVGLGGDSVGATAVGDGLGAIDGSTVGVGVGVALGGGLTGGFDGGGAPLGAGPTYAVVKFAQRKARVVRPES